MNLRFARPVKRCPRSCRKCQLVPCRQRLFRQSRHMARQLRPMTRRRRSHTRVSTVGSHLHCRCRSRFRPRFADKDFVPNPLQSEYISVSPVGIDCVSVSSVDSGENEQTNMAMVLSRFQPLNRPQLPV